MDLQQLLRDLATPSTRERAAGELLDLLKSLARKVVRGTDDEREDAVGHVAIKVLEMVEDGTVSRIEGEAYLKTMLVHKHYDRLRRSKTRRSYEDEYEHVWAIETFTLPADVSEAVLLQELRERMDRLVVEALRGRAERYREDLRRDIEQLFALAVGELEMAEVLREQGVTEDTPPAERKKIVDKVLQRHKRARDDLEKAVDRLEQSGEVDEDEAKELRRLCRLLLRCHKRPSGGVPGTGDEP